jgi:ABC-type multidrug transport system fused ATPase/permease subunit
MRNTSQEKETRIQGLRRLLPWMWASWSGYRFPSFLNVVLGVVSVGTDLAFVWATKLAIDIATHVETGVSLRTAVALLVVIILMQLSVGVGGRWVKALLEVSAENRMRRTVFARLLMGRWQEFKRFHTGDLLNRIEQDVATVIRFLTENLPLFLTTCLKFVGSFLFLFWMDRTLALLVVGVLPFFLICSKLYVKKMRVMTHEIREQESAVQATLQETLQHSLVVKTLECGGMMVERLTALQRDLHGRVLRSTKYSSFSSLIMNGGFAAGYMVTFVWGVSSLKQGLITYGALIAFIQLVGQIQTPVRTLSQFVPLFIRAFTAAERLMALEEIPLEGGEEENDEGTTSSAPLQGAVGVSVSHLSFAYDAREGQPSRDIFRDFSYDFPPGGVVAVVGDTGAGKTTLIRLLLSLVRPQEGSITLYDTAAHRQTMTAAQRCYYSYVPQGNTLMSGTLRDNLLLGNPEATETQMRQALSAAAADFVAALPHGLDTHLGEMADGFSEGQAQRIAIARALLHETPILLLDEATSALDAATERRVVANIMERYSGRTVILITHRPEALKYCTQVLTVGRCESSRPGNGLPENNSF